MIETHDSSYFEASYSPWRLLLLSLLSAGFVAAGLWMIGAFGEPPTTRRLSPEMVSFFGWLSIALFGVGFVVLLRRAMAGGVVVRVDQVGIYDARLSDNPIPWASISAMGSYSINRSKFLGFDVVDAEALDISRYARLSAGANTAISGFPYAVVMTGTDKSHDDLLEAIDRWGVSKPSSACTSEL